MPDDQSQEGNPNPPSPEEIERLKATPGFKKLLETLKHLEEYDDFSSKFLDRFPDSLPRKFRLKLGPETIGIAIVDWRAVMTKLVAFAIASSKPTELSADEYVQQIEEYFGSLTNKEVQGELLPYGSTMWHMMEFLPQKLNDAIMHLAIEGRQKIVIRRQLGIGANIPSPAKFADQVAKMEREAIKKRLPKLKPTKTKPAWKNAENLRRYAEAVEGKRLLAQCMKNMYERCDFDEGWSEDLKQDEQFQMLSGGTSSAVIAWAIRRIGDDEVSDREREPLSLACEMARRELKLPEQEIETLRTYFSDGGKLRKEDRTNRKG